MQRRSYWICYVCSCMYWNDTCTLMAYQIALLLNCDETPYRNSHHSQQMLFFQFHLLSLKKTFIWFWWWFVKVWCHAPIQIPQLVNRRGASEKSQAAKDWLVVMFFLFHVDLIVHTTDSFSNVCVHICKDTSASLYVFEYFCIYSYLHTAILFIYISF